MSDDEDARTWSAWLRQRVVPGGSGGRMPPAELVRAMNALAGEQVVTEGAVSRWLDEVKPSRPTSRRASLAGRVLGDEVGALRAAGRLRYEAAGPDGAPVKIEFVDGGRAMVDLSQIDDSERDIVLALVAKFAASHSRGGEETDES